MYVILFCAKVNIEVCLKIGLRKKWKDMVSSVTSIEKLRIAEIIKQ